MRRRKEVAKKLRAKILEDRKNGQTYEDIERKRGVSSRTIANLVKGKDPKRFCKRCGETNPNKLHEHHPDKANRPNETITLCANCHELISREQKRTRNRNSKNEAVTSKTSSPLNRPISLSPITPPQAPDAQWRPLTPSEKRWIARGLYYGTGGFAICQGYLPRSCLDGLEPYSPQAEGFWCMVERG